MVEQDASVKLVRSTSPQILASTRRIGRSPDNYAAHADSSYTASRPHIRLIGETLLEVLHYTIRLKRAVDPVNQHLKI